jgi:hypothetical protein
MNNKLKMWVPPDRLDRSRPRDVRLTGAGYALFALCLTLIIGGAAGAIALTNVSKQQYEQQQMLSKGADVDATVTNLWRSEGDSKTPWVAYTFEFGGNSYFGRSRTRLPIWEKLSVGGRLPVRVAAANPQLNVPQGSQRNPLPRWLGVLVGGMAGIAAVLSALPIRSQRRLLANGRVTRGSVTKHAKTSHGATVHYDFVLRNGARAKGHRPAGKKPAPIGSSVCVIYDSENPRRSALYPLSLVKLIRP